MHIYNKKLNGEIHECEVCGFPGELIQHHVGGKRYDDRAIWVHDLCHKKIHNPTAYGYPGNWAYDNNYLLRRSNNMVKEKKTKTCDHNKTYNDFSSGVLKIMCNYCGKSVNEPKFGSHKKNVVVKTPGMGWTDLKIKMGHEFQDPRIKQAEGLKRELAGIKINLKKYAYDKQKYEYWNNEKARVNHEMKKLQKSFED